MNNVYLVQPNFDCGPGKKQEYYLPYSVGVLWSYVNQFDAIKLNFNLAGIIFKRDRIDQVVNQLDNPKIVAFSCYVWNWEYNKKLAQKIKHHYPNCKIIFGGPQVTDRPYEKLFFFNHKYVDVVINGEGELSFYNVLVSYLEDQPLQQVYSQARIPELSVIPSPYLTGVFDQIIQDNPDLGWHAVLETNRGCPFACTFCDWGSTTYSKVKKFNFDRVVQEVQWMSDRRVEYMTIADANFGIFLERDRELALEIARIKEATGYPAVVQATWQKNSQLEAVEIAKILGSRGFTLSVQSLSPEVLTEVKRQNMKINNFEEILKYCEQEQVPTYSELILGLPQETLQSWKDGHCKLLEYGQHNMIDVFLAQLLENSEISTQIAEHGIDAVKVTDYLYGDDGINNLEPDAAESQWIIRGTNTMPFNELVDSYMFSWLITSFHYTGYTQVYSRFLYESQLATYQNFYLKLFEYAKQSDGLINSEYRRVKTFITEYLSTGQLKISGKYAAGTKILWQSLRVFPKQDGELKQELIGFLNQHYRSLFTDADVYRELVQFQLHFTVDYNKIYPYTLKVPSKIYNSIFGTAIRKKLIELEVTNKFTADTLEEFSTKLWTTRRAGYSKVAMTTVNNDIVVIPS